MRASGNFRATGVLFCAHSEMRDSAESLTPPHTPKVAQIRAPGVVIGNPGV
jgi:hypothetical protein